MTSLATVRPPEPEFRSRLGQGLWSLADPRISLASLGALFVGGALAHRDGGLAWGWMLAVIGGVLAVEVAKNASGELVDFASGVDAAVAAEDRSPFSGGKRVLVDGVLTHRQTTWIAAIAYGLAITTGLFIVAFREPHVLWLGLLGVGLAYFYHGPPLRLSYRGFGEIAVGLCYGPLLTAGTYLVAHGEVPARAVAVGVPYGLAVASFLLVNEFPDARADRGAGKRTLVVRLGRHRARWLYAAVVAAALGATVLLPLAGLPVSVLAGLVAVVPAVAAVRRLARHFADTPRLVPAQGLTLAFFLSLAAATGLALIVQP